MRTSWFPLINLMSTTYSGEWARLVVILIISWWIREVALLSMTDGASNVLIDISWPFSYVCSSNYGRLLMQF